MTYYYIFINIIAFLAYGYDKSAAKRKVQRISEKTLLSLAVFGGGFGALAAMNIFRHKTKKPIFIATTIISIVAHLYIYSKFRT